MNACDLYLTAASNRGRAFRHFSHGSHRSHRFPRSLARHGLSLLEVILAIAILGGSIAVVGELVRLGVRNAEEARELTTGQLLCESKLDEIAAGVLPAESASNVAFETDPRWTYSVQVNPLDQESLIEVRVTVQQAESNRLYPLTCTLVRWILDPSLGSSETEEGSTTEDQSPTSGQSGGTGQSATGGGNGG
jgi:type II secretion system protein I